MLDMMPDSIWMSMSRGGSEIPTLKCSLSHFDMWFHRRRFWLDVGSIVRSMSCAHDEAGSRPVYSGDNSEVSLQVT